MIEKYSFKRVIKDVHPSAVGTDGNRSVTPGTAFHAENARITSSQGNNLESVENLRGNELRVNGNMPTGNNKVVGTYEDIENFSIFYFMHNSNGNHSIHRFFGSTNTFELIVEAPGLNFSGDPITGIGVAGDNIYWTDGVNEPRYYFIENALSSFEPAILSLQLKNPSEPITTAFDTDNNLSFNEISGENWQFAYRYYFKNGGYSGLSPYSQTVVSKLYPDFTELTDNQIIVTVPIDQDVVAAVESIEVFFRINTSENWYLLEEIKEFSGSSEQVTFDNRTRGYLLPQNEVTKNDSLPIVSDALAFFKDRIFMTENTVGYDVEDGTITSTVSLVNQSRRDGLQFKEGGSYGVGIKYTDDSGRSSLVKRLGDIEIPWTQRVLAQSGAGTTTEVDGIDQRWDFDDVIELQASRPYIRAVVNGSAPSWATKAQIVLTKERRYGTYMQFPAFLAGFRTNAPEGSSADDTDVITYFNGRYYGTTLGQGNIETHHLICPRNLPFEPENGMRVRIESMDGQFVGYSSVSSFYGDAIELPERITEYNINDSPSTKLFVEVYTEADPVEDVYYEIGKVYDVSNGNVSINEILEGDMVYIDSLPQGFSSNSNRSGLNFEPLQYGENDPSNLGNGVIDNRYWNYNNDQWILNMFVQVETPSNTTTKNNNTLGFDNVFVLDYTKLVEHAGKAFVEQQRSGQDNQPNRIIFSDTFIQDSFVNGLHNFDTSNRKSIPRELGKISKLLPIAGNIMLAIHERETSSLSIGEGFLKVGDADFIVQKTESVVGDERNLQGGYGTIYPESAVEFEGQAFFFDIFKGAVVRYTLNGLFPVSNFGMRNHFQKLAQEYLPYKDQINIVAGIDVYHREYVISFPTIEGVIEGQTWAFNFDDDAWNSQYRYEPEYFGRIGNRLFSFKEGELYEHNISETYNQFYGVQTNRKVIFYANPEVTETKRMLNIHILMTGDLSVDPDLKVVVIKTPEGQESYIRAKEFVKSEGTWYAQVLKDINTPVATGLLALREGKDLRDKYFTVEIETDRIDEALLHEVSIKFVKSEYSR